MKTLHQYIEENLSDVKTNWHPKDGLFTGDNPQKIANYLLKNSKDEAQAMQRLCFYMNRAGDKLSNKTVLNKVKQILKSKKVEEKLVINKEFERIENVNDIFEDRFGKDINKLTKLSADEGGFTTIQINGVMKKWDENTKKIFKTKYDEYMNLYKTDLLEATCRSNKKTEVGPIYNAMRDFLNQHYNEMKFIYSFDGNDYYIIYFFETSKHIFTIAGHKYYNNVSYGYGNIIMLNKQ